MVSDAPGGKFALTREYPSSYFYELAKDVSQYPVTLTRGYGDG